MARERLDASTIGDVPRDETSVPAGRQEHARVGGEAQIGDRSVVPVRRLTEVACVQVEQTHGAVSGTEGHESSVRAQRRARRAASQAAHWLQRDRVADDRFVLGRRST